jgi:hypothetical protein
MSTYYQKGRANAAKGKFDLPKHGMFDSTSEAENKEQAIQEYRERYYNKRGELGKAN